MAGEIQLNGTSFASESSGTITVNNGTLGSSVVFPAGSIIQVVRPTVTVEQNALTTSYVNYYEASITLKSSNSDVFILHTFNAADDSASGFGQKIYRSITTPVTTSDTVVFNYGAVDSVGPLGWFSASGQLFLTTTTQAVDSITGQSAGDTLYYGFFYAKRGGTVTVPANNTTNGFFATTLFEIQK